MTRGFSVVELREQCQTLKMDWTLRSPFVRARPVVPLLALASCASLPDYATPKGGVVDPDQLSAADTITYRALTRSDFRAEAPPDGARQHAEKLGALTCAVVVTTPDTRYEVQERRKGNSSTYHGYFTALGFEARMDRSCSWWNSQATTTPESYILQHEQIHFALTEIEARHQNAGVSEVLSDFSVDGDDPDEIRDKIQAKLDSLLADAMERLLDRNQDFDEDTSLVHDVEAQNHWYQTVQSELGETSGAAK